MSGHFKFTQKNKILIDIFFQLQKLFSVRVQLAHHSVFVIGVKKIAFFLVVNGICVVKLLLGLDKIIIVTINLKFQ